MYCGLCIEPCPTGAIQHTREFEGSAAHLQNLVLRYVAPGAKAFPYKVNKADTAIARKPLGSIVRKALKPWDAPPPLFPSKQEAAEAAACLAAAAKAAAPVKAAAAKPVPVAPASSPVTAPAAPPEEKK
jgi:NADH-quinone oxidoreductase subunit I/NAD(P)H-quinone oxidoreductase subunit I